MSATTSPAELDTWGAEHLSAHLAAAIERTPIRTDPSPHLFVEDVFPDDFYAELKARLPVRTEAYRGWAIGQAQGMTHYQQRKQIYIHNREMLERMDLGGDEVRDFWLRFQDWFVSDALRRVMTAPFEQELRERFGGKAMPAEGQVVTNGMINFHQPGYFIGPHPDTADRLVTGIFYLAEEGAPAQELGTHFYRPKDSAYSSAQHGDFADFDRVSTAPYRPNSAVLFLRTPHSYHGVEPISEELGARSERYVLQYMLIHKR